MTAILTNKFKKDILINIEEDINDPNTQNVYYMVYAKPTQWNETDTPTAPLNNLYEEQKIVYNAVAAKKIIDCSLVIPRRDWMANSKYSQYKDTNVGHNLTPSDYVITSDYQVYICIQPNVTLDGSNNALLVNDSTIEPEGIDTAPVQAPDGYIWKYAYTVGPLRANKFMSSGYMPIDRFTDNEELDVSQRQDVINQIAVQDAAIGGQIISYDLSAENGGDGGANYSALTTATIVGDGTGATADLIINASGVIKAVIPTNYGEGYSYATVVLNDPNGTGSGASIRPVVTSFNGLGYDPRVDLRASAIMFKGETDGNTNPDLIINNDFRQIAIVKNPTFKNSNDIFTDATGNPLKYFNIDNVQFNFTPDNIIVGSVSGARAIVARHDANSTVLYFIQNEETGFEPFQIGEQLNEENGEGTATLLINDANDGSINLPEIDLNKSEVLFIDNRQAVSRSSEQKEDVKIIIQL